MKTNKLTVPISMTATLAFIITCSLSCGKRNAAPGDLPPIPEPVPTNAPADGAAPAPATNADAVAPANPDPSGAPTAVATTNPPGVTPTPAPAPEPAPTLPVTPATTKVVVMPAAPPVAPTNFYSADIAKNHQCCAAYATNQDYYFRFRAGYQHINHGDNNDTWFASVKFYARPDALRERAGKNAWLIPDAEAELSHEYLAKNDASASPGSGEGMALRAYLFWPWMHWTTRFLSCTNSVCSFCEPHTFALGPTANVGFEQLFDGTSGRFARYGGARLTFDRDGFIEYTLGATDGLASGRQQAVVELPLYTSRDGEVRYVIRGLWNRGNHSYPDELQGGLFLEMPFAFIATPSKWSDLIPFRN